MFTPIRSAFSFENSWYTIQAEDWFLTKCMKIVFQFFKDSQSISNNFSKLSETNIYWLKSSQVQAIDFKTAKLASDQFQWLIQHKSKDFTPAQTQFVTSHRQDSLFPTSSPSKESFDDLGRLKAKDMGILIQEYCSSLPRISLEKRQRISQHTSQLVDSRLANFQGLSAEQRQEVHLYTTKKEAKADYLLGPLDVLKVPCTMDYNEQWNRFNVGVSSIFYTFHAGAINIGKDARATDYTTYQTADGFLNEEKYIKAVSRLFSNILFVQALSGMDHSVIFPFGMEEFLRELPLNDSRYSDESKMQNLRQLLADAFIQSFASYPDVNVHLCVKIDEEKGSEVNSNYNAFIRAIKKSSQEKKFKLYLNKDPSHIAQQLANTMDSKVALLSCANRKLIGGNWRKKTTSNSMEEDLHSRSLLLSLLAFQLNEGQISKNRIPHALAKKVKAIGGNFTEVPIGT